jgi:eukaryotic-like serine/threonine-protein kinase
MSDPRLLNQFFHQAMAVRDAPAEGLPVELRAGVWPYEEDQLLEEGGMKRIIRCRDRRSGRLVARAEMRSAGLDCERFLREAGITAHLQHPAIMPIYEIGAKDDESPYFTMKLVEGRDLAAVLELLRKNDPQAQRDFPLEVRINIFCRICEAMAYAHQHGIIHPDLKPANIEVSAHGEVLVCDWGLARVLDEVCEDPVLK